MITGTLSQYTNSKKKQRSIKRMVEVVYILTMGSWERFVCVSALSVEMNW